MKLSRVLSSSSSVLLLAALAGCGDPTPSAPDAPATPLPAPLSESGCGVTLDEVALYQGVEVVLGKTAAAPASHADVIADRAALVRAFVSPLPVGVQLTARLTIASPAGTHSYEAGRLVEAPSTQSDLASTLNFSVPAGDLAPDATLSLEVSAPALCPDRPAARFPATGALSLHPLRTGTLKVTLVPIRYDTDHSGRLPDTSPEQLERFRSLLQAMFPVAAVELSVRAPVGTSVAVADQNGWTSLLDSVRALRASDAPPADVYYYGLVEPAPSSSGYCLASCIGGISYVAPPGNAGLRAGVGVGFPGLVTAESMAHELGHQHGRPHAPCGPVSQVDAAYPYAGASVGDWGLDLRGTMSLEGPEAKDLMSYCEPRWISDYTFRALAARSAQVNDAAPQAEISSSSPRRWRVLLVDGAGAARWGLDADGAPPGEPVDADELDAAGAVRGTLRIWRAPLAEGEGATYWVPLPAPSDAAAIRAPGAAPLPFSAPPSVGALVP